MTENMSVGEMSTPEQEQNDYALLNILLKNPSIQKHPAHLWRWAQAVMSSVLYQLSLL